MGDVLGDLGRRAAEGELLKQARAVVRLELKAREQCAELLKTLDDVRTARRFLRDLAASKVDELSPPDGPDEPLPGEHRP